MGLLNAKCVNCGATIKVDESKEATICKYCGSAFVTENAINNYNMHITNNMNIANANILVSGFSAKNEYDRGITFISLENYEKADQISETIMDKEPISELGYKLKIISVSKNFDVNFVVNNKNVIDIINKLQINLQKFCSDEDFLMQLNDYSKKVDSEIKRINDHNQMNEKKKAEKKQQLTDYEKKLHNHKKLALIFFILFIIFLFLALIFIIKNITSLGVIFTLATCIALIAAIIIFIKYLILKIKKKNFYNKVNNLNSKPLGTESFLKINELK